MSDKKGNGVSNRFCSSENVANKYPHAKLIRGQFRFASRSSQHRAYEQRGKPDAFQWIRCLLLINYKTENSFSAFAHIYLPPHLVALTICEKWWWEKCHCHLSLRSNFSSQIFLGLMVLSAIVSTNNRRGFLDFSLLDDCTFLLSEKLSIFSFIWDYPRI